MDITKNLEQTLNERIIKLEDIQGLQLTDESHILNELNKLCERKAAYRVKVDGFVGYQFLWNLILDTIKMENDVNALMVNERHLSQNIVSKMLNSMENEGLIKKEDNSYRAVLDKILSKDVISRFFWGRADKITIEEILNHFRFKPTCKVYGAITPSAAYEHTKQIIDQFCQEGKLQKATIGNSFSWSDV